MERTIKASSFPRQRNGNDTSAQRKHRAAMKPTHVVGSREARSSEFDSMIRTLLSLPDDQLAMATGILPQQAPQGSIDYDKNRSNNAFDSDKGMSKNMFGNIEQMNQTTRKSALLPSTIRTDTLLPSVPLKQLAMMDMMKQHPTPSSSNPSTSMGRSKRGPYHHLDNPKLKLAYDMGVYPLATPERVQAATLLRLEQVKRRLLVESYEWSFGTVIPVQIYS
jgi:hypothetical protein